MSGQVSRGSAGQYQADERVGVVKSTQTTWVILHEPDDIYVSWIRADSLFLKGTNCLVLGGFSKKSLSSPPTLTSLRAFRTPHGPAKMDSHLISSDRAFLGLLNCQI